MPKAFRTLQRWFLITRGLTITQFLLSIFYCWRWSSQHQRLGKWRASSTKSPPSRWLKNRDPRNGTTSRRPGTLWSSADPQGELFREPKIMGFSGRNEGFLSYERLPSGKHTKSYWKWWFIVDLPTKNGDFP
jgi:hypothetical protein